MDDRFSKFTSHLGAFTLAVCGTAVIGGTLGYSCTLGVYAGTRSIEKSERALANHVEKVNDSRVKIQPPSLEKEQTHKTTFAPITDAELIRKPTVRQTPKGQGKTTTFRSNVDAVEVDDTISEEELEQLRAYVLDTQKWFKDEEPDKYK